MAKQKVSVRAQIKQDGKVLLGRRAAGRESLRGFFELPGGEVEFGETPEEALERQLETDLGLHVQTAQLARIVTEIDIENPGIQHIVIVFTVGLSQPFSIELSAMYDHYEWKELLELQPETLTSTTVKALELSAAFTEAGYTKNAETDVNKTKKQFIIYGDGGSRGNPGPSAAGFIIMDTHEAIIAEGGKYLGITTNNQAEYQAVLLALEKAQELGGQEIECRLDSLLVVNQMNGIFKIKNRELWPVHSRIKELVESFEHVRFMHVHRELNTLADAMVNKVLDQEAAQ